MTEKRRLTILVTRPRSESEVFALTLAMRGHDAVQAPLLDIVPDETASVDLDGVQALLFTSINGVRSFARVSTARHVPAYCVGDATAQAARDMGFRDVHSAGGDVVALANLVRMDLAPSEGALLHVSGSAVAGDLAGDLGVDRYDVRRVQLYRQDTARDLPDAAAQALKAGTLDAIAFFSPRTAATFVQLVRKADLLDTLKTVSALGLSQAALDAARVEGAHWKSERAAAQPTEAALLEAIDALAAEAPPQEAPKPEAFKIETDMPEPKPATKRPALGAIAVALVVGVAGAFAFTYWQTHMMPSESATALRAIDLRLAAIDRRLTALENKPAPEPVVTAAPAPAPAAAPVDLSPLEQRLATLEQRPAADPALAETIARLTQENRELAQTLATIRSEAQTIREGGERDRADVKRAEFLLAVGQLRDAALAGRGFAPELTVVRGLAPDNAASLLQQLDARSGGVETRAALARRFPAIANAVVAAARVEAASDTPVLAEALERVQKFLSIRRVGEVDGDSATARVARAEARLAVEDLPGALAALDPPGPAWLAPAAEWMEAARARLAVEAALQRLASGG
ncbi:MAG: uroporphyrinogen-III synthase [Alphaproteobacteria bacterium]|nr:uroporphyrinogen-III synthase [Alphaproteobacteria bacterium]